MSQKYRYAIIGTGFPHGSPGATGFGMAHIHYPAFASTGKVELVAIAEPNTSAAQAFIEKHHITPKIYADYRAMLTHEQPDIVSICTWPHLHAEMVMAAAEAGVRAIHCEKPMAITWGDCKKMKATADAHGAKLTFNHQRRHLLVFQAVRDAIARGDIGELVQIEAQCPNLFDWGTHWLDMLFFYNQETPAEWVIGQIDSRQERRIFGAYHEEQGLCHFKWQNGVRGWMVTGYEAGIGCTHRLVGKEGIIEVLSERKYRITGKTTWEEREFAQEPFDEHRRSAADVVQQLEDPTHRALLSADFALQSTEVIFATYYSSKIRGRVDLPLAYEGNALLDMVETGEVGPKRAHTL